jgi:hypothetical protein
MCSPGGLRYNGKTDISRYARCQAFHCQQREKFSEAGRFAAPGQPDAGMGDKVKNRHPIPALPAASRRSGMSDGRTLIAAQGRCPCARQTRSPGPASLHRIFGLPQIWYREGMAGPRQNFQAPVIAAAENMISRPWCRRVLHDQIGSQGRGVRSRTQISRRRHHCALAHEH